MSQFRRIPLHRYEDPLAQVWINCAANVGFRIERSPEVYASSDGLGTIFLGTDDSLDPDDSLAQMIFHELCHALVEGDDGESRTDWGLDNTSGRHTWREHACLRLQAYLAASVGLRDFFAPTTDFRLSFWNALAADPFWASTESGGRRERSCVAARIAAWRASQARWAPHLQQALSASAAIAGIVAKAQPAKSLTEKTLPSLWETVVPPPRLHPGGHAFIAAYQEGPLCGDCAWYYETPRSGHCRHVPMARVGYDMPVCSRWEPADDLDCRSCGACCREAYHAVEVSTRDPVNKRHPELVVIEASRRRLQREGDRCAALCGGREPGETYRCTIYEDRPRTCREFSLGSGHCLDARRRVGLSL